MLDITNESNYLAKVVQLGTPEKHPNADRLQLWDVGGYTVITDLSRKEGDICVFFPVECQIHHDILHNMDMYSDKDLNSNKDVSGYVSKTRRIKAVALRGVVSDGIVLPLEKILHVLSIIKGGPLYNPRFWANGSVLLGELFDTIDGVVICNKYVPPTKEVRSGGGQGKPKKNPLKQYLIEGQFNFHYSTSKLQENIWRFEYEDDIIVITDKWHGTSAVFSNVLTKRKLTFWEGFKKFFGANIPTEEFSKMYASRSVIKSIEGKYNNPLEGYYNTDIWGKVFGEIKHLLFEHMTIYGEIVGYTGEKMIQKGYDYGCKPGEHKFVVYRITSTFGDKVQEWGWWEIEDFCREHGLETVPVLYKGSIKNLIEQSSRGEFDPATLLGILKKTYLEKDCKYCSTKVPAEGICIRNESGNKIAYKLKSRRFLEGESKALDAGEEVIE